ncbi:hypothetical protein [Candidatus Planktophila versatilis]|uniref:Dehydrogenase n=1 Tax=Candidatus Planktophila versatilis TaxID=1884905 RepID=A0ABM6MFZ2_9ACTN|nr:hypothetical protein [Candidatus Planktophila versatilis]ASY17818.1 hypothetical protein A1sIA79_06430 [Candidatus Planktophila versatilis]
MKILVLGAGWRVQNDVLPALIGCGVSPEDIAIVRRKPSSVPGHEAIECFSNISELPQDFISDSILLCSLPTGEVFQMLSTILTKGKPASILVDTPISMIQSELKSLEWLYQIQFNVLEDSVLIPWLDDIKDLKPAVVFIKHGLYYYHGTALMSYVANRKLFRISPWSLSDSFPWIFLDSRLRAYIIWGSKNPNKAGGFVLSTFGRLVRDSNFVSTRTVDYAKGVLGESFESIGSDGSLTRSSPLSSMDEWKRIGLMLGLRKLIFSKEMAFPSIDEAIVFEQLSCWDQSHLIIPRIFRKARKLIVSVPGGKMLIKGIRFIRNFKN